MMRTQNPCIVMITFMLAMLVGSVNSLAEEKSQEKAPAKPDRDVVAEQREVIINGQGPEGHLPWSQGIVIDKPGDVTFNFVSSEMSFGGKIVKGAPYSAEAITETTQTLSDGNRINRKSTASVYRDSEGRTRRDQTLGAIGPWAAAGEPPQMIFINDPGAGVNYILDPRSRTARKPTLPSSKGKPGEPSEVKRRFEGKQVQIWHDSVHGPPLRPELGEFHVAASSSKAKTESLGKQMIEGLQAEGTRSVITIPAGEVGNELPIQIISEHWHSPELQTVIMTKRSDPRFGETVYRLTNINRSEPARSLFEVPSDYTIKDEQTFLFERRKKPNEEK